MKVKIKDVTQACRAAITTVAYIPERLILYCFKPETIGLIRLTVIGIHDRSNPVVANYIFLSFENEQKQ